MAVGLCVAGTLHIDLHPKRYTKNNIYIKTRPKLSDRPSIHMTLKNLSRYDIRFTSLKDMIKVIYVIVAV